MYKRETNKRYQVSEASDCEQIPEKNFYKFYAEQKPIRPRTSFERTSSKPTRNAYLERKKIGNAYSERNVMKPSSTRAKRKLKEEIKAKKYSTDYFDCKDSEFFKPQSNDFFSSEVSTFIENILQRDSFDINSEELYFLEAQLNLKDESSEKNIARQNLLSEIEICEDAYENKIVGELSFYIFICFKKFFFRFYLKS